VNLAPLVEAAAAEASREVAEKILADSQGLVPVETGALKDSGKVTQEGTKATVSYDVVSEEDGYPYGIRQHEDMSLHHPNGGQAKFLEQPFRADPAAKQALAAAVLRRVLGR
jgi:hypothetical protein